MKSVIVACIVCLLGINIVKGTDCPDLWIPYSGSCYRFGHQGLTFVEAEHYCQQHQGHLVHIETKDENEFLQEELNYFKAVNWWIGLTDDDIEGHWMWYGTNIRPEYTDWDSKQPDNAGQNEDCVEMVWHATGAKWNDLDCHRSRPPICEKTSEDANTIIG